MSKKYESLAGTIVEKVGGSGNISAVRHCQTRLRFTLRDTEKADKEGIGNLDGVAQVVESGGMFQVVIGMHVAEVFEEVEKLVPDREGQEEPDKGNGKKMSPVDYVIDFVSSVFQPIVPALSGAGMLKALMALLTVFHLVNSDSQTYYILNFFADATFAFLPILLAYTTAKRMKCNAILAMSVAGIMCHANWMALVAADEPVKFFGVIPFYLVSYTSTVIPVILVIIVQSFVEKWLNKVIPKAVNLVFVPMFTFLIMGTLALSVLGPVGDYVGEGLALVFDWLSTNASWAPAALIGGLFPVMVMFGIHHAVAPLGSMQMASLGFDSIFGPGCVCSNIAQGVAALVVGLRTRESKTRQLGLSTGVTALMGITEPVLYGLNLPKKYPLVSAMIGGGLGGLYAGVTHTHRFATGSSGIPAVLLYIGDDTMSFFWNIIISLLITAVSTAAITFILSLKFEKSVEIQAQETAAIENEEKNTVYAPVNGKIVEMGDIPDPTFSEGVLGWTMGIYPEDGIVRAPFTGKIVQVSDTGHAIGLEGNDGMELLIHVGVDTVEMGGMGFEPKVKEGDEVNAGQELLVFDRKAVADAGHPDVVVVIVLNADDYTATELVAEGTVAAGTKIIQLKK
ncbi:beta-glucoside-specific PTS transporter subunit IIABC [Lachnospiraceae bacterium 47-T17]